MKKVNLFRENLLKNDTGIIGKRVDIIERQAMTASRRAVDSIQEEIDSLEVSILNLEDLNRTDSTSLTVGDGNFNAAKWVGALNELMLRKESCEIKLRIAQSNYDKYFNTIEK